MRSTCVNTIRRQQYRRSPSSSNASPSLKSAWSRLKYVSHLLPITLPHVKHRTGMIMVPRCPAFILYPLLNHSAPVWCAVGSAFLVTTLVHCLRSAAIRQSGEEQSRASVHTSSPDKPLVQSHPTIGERGKGGIIDFHE